jgi:hypothetical protein
VQGVVIELPRAQSVPAGGAGSVSPSMSTGTPGTMPHSILATPTSVSTTGSSIAAPALPPGMPMSMLLINSTVWTSPARGQQGVVVLLSDLALELLVARPRSATEHLSLGATACFRRPLSLHANTQVGASTNNVCCVA